MRNRSIGTLVALALVAAPLGAQVTTRWNANANPDDALDVTPAVQLWFTGPSFVPRGGAVRVNFRVEEDAHVVVARVDWSGRLTVLFPVTRTRSTLVRGGVDRRIDGSRLGALGSFIASEQPGMSGYVFAIASYTPFDLSGIASAEFQRYMTGFANNRPATRYLGDPHRVVSRFAETVLYDQNAPFDYDVAFYSVDQPTYSSIAGFSSFCRQGFRDSFYYGMSRFGTYDDFESDLCGSLNSWYNSCSSFSYSWAYGSPFGCYSRRNWVVASNPGGPLTSPPKDTPPDSGKVNPWVPDSINAPNVDRHPKADVDKDKMDVPKRPLPVAVGGDEDDRSFSIPERALPRLRRDRARGEDRPSDPAAGNRAMPARSTPDVAGANPNTDWVRPPRDVAPADNDGRLPSRTSLRDGSPRDRGPDRPRDFVSERGREPTYNPPPRRSPERTPRGENRGSSGGSSPMPAPPRRIESSGGGSRGSSPPPRAVESSQPRSQPRSEPARSPTTERKPDERKPDDRKP